jgi:hypothetical protein
MAKKVGPIYSGTCTRVSGQLYFSCITPGQHIADNIHISHNLEQAWAFKKGFGTGSPMGLCLKYATD